MRQRYVEHGYTGLFDQRRGKRSIHRIPMETAERVLKLYPEKYAGFNVRHVHEKLREGEGIELSYSWVKQALQGAGLVAKTLRRSERNFGPWQGRLPQELRLAGITTLEKANRFLEERSIAEFNRKFAAPAVERQTAFRPCPRRDLDWVFRVQTERAVHGGD
jgi:hypothetical protein